MTNFEVGQKVIVDLPELGGRVNGTVLFNNLNGPAPILIRCDTSAGEICIQVPATGAGIVSALAKPDDIRVSYIFADGTATNWADTDQAAKLRGERPAVGAFRAVKSADGVYSKHEYVSFADEEQVVPEKEAPVTATPTPELPPELKALFEQIFGKGKRR